MGNKEEDKVRRAAREIIGYTKKDIRLTHEEFGQVNERYGIGTEEELQATAIEVRDQGREYIQQLIGREQLGILGTLLIVKLDVMDTLISIRHKIRRSIGR